MTTVMPRWHAGPGPRVCAWVRPLSPCAWRAAKGAGSVAERIGGIPLSFEPVLLQWGWAASCREFHLALPLCDGGAERMDDVAVRVRDAGAAATGRGFFERLTVGEQFIQVEGEVVQRAGRAVGGLGPHQRQAHPPVACPVG